MAEFDYDLLVVGAGSGGMRAARVAASHGARVALAEEYQVGGTCVIRGCVPKKMLLYGSQFAQQLGQAARFGWRLDQPSFDWLSLRDTVQAEVQRLRGLYESTLHGHGIALFPERAVLEGEQGVRLASGRELRARVILLANGARPHVPDIQGSEHGLTSNEMFHLPQVPERLVVVGAGYIANEFAGIFHRLGSRVTLLNRSGTMLRDYDHALSERLLQLSQAQGIGYHANAALQRIERHADELLVRVAGLAPVPADVVLFATGRRPNTEGLGLERAGVRCGADGAILVDAESRTSAPGVYAVGDVTGRIQLTPVAIREGQAFAERVFGGADVLADEMLVPAAVFSDPPLAMVGLTEREARRRHGKVHVYQADFRPMRNAMAGSGERALYKMVVHAETDVVLGLHMIGPDAPEILQAAAVAVRAGLTRRAFDDTVALHPTMAEELVLMKKMPEPAQIPEPTDMESMKCDT
ncbi:MAG: glutathione-disulfide reductase [Pseudomonadota bacterium]